MKSMNCSFCAPIAAVASLILLTGCDDPDARNTAQEANRQVLELRSQLENAKKKNEDTEASIKELKVTLLKHLDERMDKLNEAVAENHKQVLVQIGQDVKMTRDAATNLADTARADNDKELKATKQLVAENMQAIRAEFNAEVEKLKKFMDNQLKETYPYAYQPRRMDPATPPGEQSTETPKKPKEEAAPEQK